MMPALEEVNKHMNTRLGVRALLFQLLIVALSVNNNKKFRGFQNIFSWIFKIFSRQFLIF